MLSSEIQPIDGVEETVKTDTKSAVAKMPLELQVNMLCSKIQNPKELPSTNWVEAIFNNVESMLGKEKVLDINFPVQLNCSNILYIEFIQINVYIYIYQMFTLIYL